MTCDASIGKAETISACLVPSSAFPIDDNQVKALVPQLEAVFKTRLETSVTVDPSLIGGIKVVVGDQMLDASVRGKLDAMATALNH